MTKIIAADHANIVDIPEDLTGTISALNINMDGPGSAQAPNTPLHIAPGPGPLPGGGPVQPGQVITTNGTNSSGGGFDVFRDNDHFAFEVGGVPLFTVHEELPKDAAVGALAYIRGEATAYVYDGLDWVNLGELARAMRANKCNRKAAVAATKAKHCG